MGFIGSIIPAEYDKIANMLLEQLGSLRVLSILSAAERRPRDAPFEQPTAPCLRSSPRNTFKKIADLQSSRLTREGEPLFFRSVGLPSHPASES